MTTGLGGATVLVTGATGFVGRHLSAALAARGCRVVPFARGAPEAGDVLDRAALDLAMRGVDSVAHRAVSAGYRADADPRRDAEVNVVGTLNVLLAAGERGVRRVLHVSSAHAYGSGRARVSEDDPPLPTSLHGASKLAAEEYARMFARAGGLRLTIVRLAALYGEAVRGEAPPNVVTRFVDRALAGLPVVITGDPQGKLDLLHVADAVEGCVRALETPAAAGALYNLGGAAPLSLLELAETVVRACGSGSSVESGDPRPSTLLPVLDIAKASRELGFSPTIGVGAGIARFVSARRRQRAAGPDPA